MKVQWTTKALSDLARLHDFLAPVNRRAAARIVKSLTAAARRLRDRPRIGERLEEFAPREVRRILAGPYEIRYEVKEDAIYCCASGTQGRIARPRLQAIAFAERLVKLALRRFEAAWGDFS
jgi:plasmid stabilization system protein ParE